MLNKHLKEIQQNLRFVCKGDEHITPSVWHLIVRFKYYTVYMLGASKKGQDTRENVR